MATVSFPRCVFRFFKLFQEQEELFDILYGTISSICTISLLRTNIQLYALSAVRRAYLRLEKMVYFLEVEMNYIFKMQHRIVITLTENILLKIRIIFIEKPRIRYNLHKNMF